MGELVDACCAIAMLLGRILGEVLFLAQKLDSEIL
jgi:hypothetical protein